MEEKIMKQLAKQLVEFAIKNKKAKIGEIVETIWGNWKKPQKVKIYEIEGCISTKSGSNDCIPTITYNALRLKKDGTPKDKIGCGICLTNFKTENGIEWKRIDQPINHVGLHFSIPNSELDEKRNKEGWMR